MTQQPKNLLDQVRACPEPAEGMQYGCRAGAGQCKHYAYSTVKTYLYWAKRFVLYHDKRHPPEMGESEFSEFLTFLAVEENVAASTQNLARSALLFLYREVLRKDLNLPIELVWAKRPKRLPTVLTKEQVRQVIAQLTGVHRLIVQLLYGSGLRLTLAPRLRAARVQVWNACPVHSANAPGCQAKLKGMRLRVKDLDFGQRQILVRDAEGGKDRVTAIISTRTLCRKPSKGLPRRLASPNGPHLPRVRSLSVKLLCRPPAGRAARLRHPHRPRTAGPQGRENDHDAKRAHVLNRGGLAVRSPLD